MKRISTDALREEVTARKQFEAMAEAHTELSFDTFAAIRKEVKAMPFDSLCVYATQAGILEQTTEVGMTSAEANDAMEVLVDEFGTVKALSMLASAVAYVAGHYPDNVEAANFAKRIVRLSDEIEEYVGTGEGLSAPAEDDAE